MVAERSDVSDSSTFHILLTVINNKIRTPFSFWSLLPGFMRV